MSVPRYSSTYLTTRNDLRTRQTSDRCYVQNELELHGNIGSLHTVPAGSLDSLPEIFQVVAIALAMILPMAYLPITWDMSLFVDTNLDCEEKMAKGGHPA